MKGTRLLSEELMRQVEKTALEQKRQPAEVVADAVRKYLEEQKWVRFVERHESRAQAKDIGEDEPPES